MKKGWERFFKVIGIGVFAVLVMISVGKVKTVVAKSQTTSPCCVDRWDPEWTERDMWGPGMMGPGQHQRMARHWTFMHGGIPSEYRGQFNALVPTHSAVKDGGILYQQKCAVCHGAEGMGDGVAAKSLSPSPALLAYMIQTPMLVDEYLMWSISEGGMAFGTAMPAFKDKLSAEEIWKIIAFMRAGFPPLAQM